MTSSATLYLVFCYVCAVVFLTSLYRSVVFRLSENRNRLWAGIPPGLMSYQRGKLNYIKNCKEVVAQGLEKYGNRLFWVPTLIGPVAVIPPAQINEVKSNPHLSFAHYSYDALAGDYTDSHHPHQMPGLFSLIRKKLIKSSSLNSSKTDLWEETQLALNEYFPATEEWASVVIIYQQFVTTISRVTGRVIVGTSLCRDPEWIELTSDFFINILTAGMTLRNFPSFTHPIIQYAIPRLYRIKKSYPRATKLISQVVAMRHAQQERLGDKYEKPIDALQCAMDMGQSGESLAKLLLTLGGISIHGIAAALTNIIYDLCEYPWIIPELRQEIEEVMGGGHIPEAPGDLNKLRLLDGLMKESHRMNPVQLCKCWQPPNMKVKCLSCIVTMQRKSMADITLSSGCVIPADSYISVPTFPVFNNPNIYPNPTKFDPYRFLRLRERPGEEHLHQFVSTNDKFFGFGLGAHTCPGRFFAAIVMKMTLAVLLTKYDFQYPQSQGSKVKRPKNQTFEEINGVCLTQKIEFRKRSLKV